MFTAGVLVEEAVDVGVVERLDADDVEARLEAAITKSPCSLSVKPPTIAPVDGIERRHVRAEDAGAVQRDRAADRARGRASRRRRRRCP